MRYFHTLVQLALATRRLAAGSHLSLHFLPTDWTVQGAGPVDKRLFVCCDAGLGDDVWACPGPGALPLRPSAVMSVDLGGLDAPNKHSRQRKLVVTSRIVPVSARLPSTASPPLPAVPTAQGPAQHATAYKGYLLVLAERPPTAGPGLLVLALVVLAYVHSVCMETTCTLLHVRPSAAQRSPKRPLCANCCARRQLLARVLDRRPPVFCMSIVLRCAPACILCIRSTHRPVRRSTPLETPVLSGSVP